MHQYSTIEMTEIRRNKCVFSKLIENGRCFFDEFEEKITKNNDFRNEFEKILTLMDHYANGMQLPSTKFNNIKDGIFHGIFWEFKTKHLRVYTVCVGKGKVVVIGGTKNTQKKDIMRFKKISIEFIKS
jgi:hypothetical protein